MEKDSKIAILGYGIEGRAMAEYLLRHEYTDITICDKNEDLVELLPHLKTQVGNAYLNDLEQFDIIFRSPGISCLHPKLFSVREKVTSQINYFLEHSPALSIGITGTKGKGTTSTLIHKILLESQKISFLGGNIGNPAVEYLDKLNEDDFAVLELSSFQLQDLKKSLNIGVILNITSEHLDYHADREEYVSAKMPIIKHQTDKDFIVLNEDYETSKNFMNHTNANVFTVSTKHETRNGAYILNDKIFIKIGEEEMFLLGVDEVGLLGPHNFENVLPAITVARILGVDLEIIKKIVKEFSGLPHRLEFVDEIEGVKYYNDSFSTVPETAIAALNSFDQGSSVILLGGSEKYSEFSELGKVITEKLALPICYGVTGSRIKEAILATNPSYPIHEVKNMEEGFAKARELAKQGDTVLLSPASASFDLFKNYKERGKRFRELVQSLKKENEAQVE